MALKNSDILRDAIRTVVRACGDDPAYKELADKLTSVEDDLAAPGSRGDTAREERDGEDDDYSFETAQKRHKERTAAKADAEREPAEADEKEGEDK